MSIVSNIKLLCKQRNTTIGKISKELNISSGIYRWDKNTPSVDKLITIADYFNVSVDYLIGRQKEVSSGICYQSDTELMIRLLYKIGFLKEDEIISKDNINRLFRIIEIITEAFKEKQNPRA